MVRLSQGPKENAPHPACVAWASPGSTAEKTLHPQVIFAIVRDEPLANRIGLVSLLFGVVWLKGKRGETVVEP